MRSEAWLGSLFCAVLSSCAGGRSGPPSAPAESHEEPTLAEGDASADAFADTSAMIVVPAKSPPPSTASYEEATSVPEALDVNDDRTQLTDVQLTGPIRGVLSGCRVPSNAKVTIKTAVQYGRAIGVTITVAFARPKPAKRVSAATAKAEEKMVAKITACADRAVRVVNWPPSRRRDSFTTVF